MSLEDGHKNTDIQRDAIERLDLPNHIVVTSTSAIKTGAVKKILSELFPTRNFEIIGVKADSGISEQPVNEETEQGAKNRIRSAESLSTISKLQKGSAFVSIENGIFSNENGEWEDKAVAVIKLPEGKMSSALSPKGVLFPVEAIEATRAKEGGFQKNTVGSVIAEMYATRGIQIDKQDPHSALTEGNFTREEQMISAVREALLKLASE